MCMQDYYNAKSFRGQNVPFFLFSRGTIWNHRVRFLEDRVLSSWTSFTIWNAGKQGKKLYRSLSPANQKKVSWKVTFVQPHFSICPHDASHLTQHNSHKIFCSQSTSWWLVSIGTILNILCDVFFLLKCHDILFMMDVESKKCTMFLLSTVVGETHL